MPPTPPADPAPAPAAPTAFDLTLEEACIRLSSAHPSVEMVAGFHADERVKGRLKDSLEAYEARFEAFQVRPVH